jgi:hypothetical protein
VTEEAKELCRDLSGCVLDEEVRAGLDGPSGDVGRIDAPEGERVFIEPSGLPRISCSGRGAGWARNDQRQ